MNKLVEKLIKLALMLDKADYHEDAKMVTKIATTLKEIRKQ
jgi:hypothetical protein